MSHRALQRGIAVLLAILLAWSSVRAQEDYAGEFVASGGSVELDEGSWTVSAEFDLSLSPEAADLLHAPVPLTIRIEAQCLSRLRVWWDPIEAEVIRNYRLTYLPVRNRYLVRDIDSDLTRNFAELQEALDFIGHVDRLVVVDAADLDDDKRYEIRIRTVLDKSDLPAPLAFLAFWRKSWSIGSDWLIWQLADE